MKILYLCTGNSARSLMAEAFTRQIVPPNAPIEVFSAGTHPGVIHPETVAVMGEVGVDMTPYASKGIEAIPFDSIDIVVTLCDDARRSCPAPPTGASRIHWGLRDPVSEDGPPAPIHRRFQATRDEVHACVRKLMFELATARKLRPGT